MWTVENSNRPTLKELQEDITVKKYCRGLLHIHETMEIFGAH